jgi:cytochrome c5
MSPEPRRGAGVRRAAVLVLLAGAMLAFAVAEIFAQASTSSQVHGSLGQRRQDLVSADRWPRRRRAYPHELPSGTGHEIATRACLICHGAMLITQQHKDSAAWAKTVGTMTTWGAPIDSTESQTLRGWLVTEFGPRH